MDMGRNADIGELFRRAIALGKFEDFGPLAVADQMPEIDGRKWVAVSSDIFSVWMAR